MSNMVLLGDMGGDTQVSLSNGISIGFSRVHKCDGSQLDGHSMFTSVIVDLITFGDAA